MYSRNKPSPRYKKLLSEYAAMHEDGRFSGIGCFKWRKQLRTLINETGSKTLIDYGCGHGVHLKEQTVKALFAKLNVFCSSWTEALGVESITGYDPASDQYSILPEGQFDGAICIDVLEHIDENDLPWVIDEIFSYATKFVFLTVATVPAKKNLPNGENAHVTIRDQDWWNTLIDPIAKKYPNIRYFVVFEDGVE